MRRRSLAMPMGLLFVSMFVAACGGEQAEAPPPGAADAAAPPSATPAPDAASGDVAMVEAGAAVFSGPGLCFSCHAPGGVGTALGPNLTDDTWLWIEEPAQDLQGKIVALVRTGVPTPREAPAPMLPMGGASLTDEQLQAVSAYVASLSQ